MSTKFQELLAAISSTEADQSVLAKSLQAAPDDKQVAAAAGEAGALTPEEIEAAEAAAAAAKEKGAGGEGGEGGKEKEMPFAKSMTGADGEEIAVIDPAEFMKSVNDSVGDSIAQVAGPLLALVKQQGAMLKSMGEQLVALGGQGRGRKAVFAAVERPAAGTQGTAAEVEAEELKKSQAGKLEEFFAKAGSAFEARKITGQEYTVIDVSRRHNQPLDPALIRKVMAA